MATSSGSDQAVAGMGTFPSVKSSQANVDTTDIVLTAYSITSAYTSDGVCITTSGAPVMLSESYYTVTDPTGVPSSDFPRYAASQFLKFFRILNLCRVRGGNCSHSTNSRKRHIRNSGSFDNRTSGSFSIFASRSELYYINNTTSQQCYQINCRSTARRANKDRHRRRRILRSPLTNFLSWIYMAQTKASLGCYHCRRAGRHRG